jgi:hypothetical protein
MAHFGGSCHCGCSRARSLREAGQQDAGPTGATTSIRRRPKSAPASRDLVEDLLERARSAAFSPRADRRGWEAVRTAALLRGRGDHGRALSLLDEVVTRFEDEAVVTAAYSCATAIHSDMGDPLTAIRVGSDRLSRHSSEALENALARAYWERFEQTGDEVDFDAWRRFRERLADRPPRVLAG